MTTIAVTGAAGQLGRYVIAKLKEKIAPSDIVAIVRNTSKSKNLGVAVRQADYTDPGALGAAMQGIDKLLLISGNEIGKRIDAWRKHKVSNIQYTSRRLFGACGACSFFLRKAEKAIISMIF